MVIDLIGLARIGVGALEFDRFMEVLTPENAGKWVDDLTNAILSNNFAVAYGAAMTISTPVHSIFAILDEETEAQDEDLEIPKFLSIETDVDEASDYEDENRKYLDDKLLLIYDAMHECERNIRFYEVIFAKVISSHNLNLISALADLLCESIYVFGVEPSYLETCRERVKELLDRPNEITVRIMFEYALDFIEEEMLDWAEN